MLCDQPLQPGVSCCDVQFKPGTAARALEMWAQVENKGPKTKTNLETDAQSLAVIEAQPLELGKEYSKYNRLNS